MYRTDAKAVTSVVLAWLGFVATVSRCVFLSSIKRQVVGNNKHSTVVLFASHRHDDRHGPRSTYGQSLNNGTMTPGDVGVMENKDTSG